MKAKYLAILFLFCVILSCINAKKEKQGGKSSTPVVNISQGKVSGQTRSSRQGTRYYSFEGIYYAKPPVGNLRFQAPVALDSWEGVRKAHKSGPPCPQLDFENNLNYVGEENCLSLNVYTPELPSSSEDVYKAVMVYIHGGGFFYGNSSFQQFNPGYFMDKDVVLVILNYRLGVLGFLTTNDEVVPGNAGLLDQTEALQWVKKNIHAFGGNPLHVTLFGQSAGAASALYHLVSPLSKGLFHRVIAQSGSPLCPWAFQREPQMWSQELGFALGCPTKSTELISCLQKISAKKLVEKVAEKFDLLFWPLPFLPAIDIGRSHPFLSDIPEELLNSAHINRVPVISGITKNEGYSLYLVLKETGILNKLNKDEVIELLLKSPLGFKRNLKQLTEAVKHEYFANSLLENKGSFDEDLIQFISDGMNNICNAITVDIISSNGLPSYMYVFDHQSSNKGDLEEISKTKGIGHGSELPYLFERRETELSPEDEIVSDIILTYWTNFAKFSVPVLDVPRSWIPQHTGSNRTYMKINANPIQVDDEDISNKINFWYQTLPKLENIVNIRNEL